MRIDKTIERIGTTAIMTIATLILGTASQPLQAQVATQKSSGEAKKPESEKSGQTNQANRGKSKMGREIDYTQANTFENGAAASTCDRAKLLDGTYNGSNYSKSDTGTALKTGGDRKVVQSIGEAWLEKDGSITLNLRSDADGNPVDARFSYKPTDKGYEGVLKHLNGLKPGETKPVPPWPDKIEKK